MQGWSFHQRRHIFIGTETEIEIEIEIEIATKIELAI